MNNERILLLGGTGFIGRAVAEQLARRGYAITVPTRQRDRHKHLLVLPSCTLVGADIHDPVALDRLMTGHDAVINLVGILRGNFHDVHALLPRRIAEACIKNGGKRFLHVSALNADENGPSEYLRSRGRGELAIWEVFGCRAAAATIFRPSIVFGEDDRFLNLLSRLAAKCPVVPLGSPGAQFQPVWVGDVARAVVESLGLSETGGKTYPLVGPRVYTMRELLDFVIALNGQKRTVINLPHTLATLQAVVFEFPPGKWLGDAMGFTLTRDNVRSMTLPNVSAEPFPALFGTPAALECIVPAYLHSGRAQYQSFRYGAGR